VIVSPPDLPSFSVIDSAPASDPPHPDDPFYFFPSQIPGLSPSRAGGSISFPLFPHRAHFLVHTVLSPFDSFLINKRRPSCSPFCLFPTSFLRSFPSGPRSGTLTVFFSSATRRDWVRKALRAFFFGSDPVPLSDSVGGALFFSVSASRAFPVKRRGLNLLAFSSA